MRQRPLRLEAPLRYPGWRHRGAIVSLSWLTAVSCALTTTYVTSPVDKDKARYIGGTTAAGLSAPSSRLSALKVSGAVESGSQSEFIVDAGRDGEELSTYRTRLARRFAEAFVRAYREANGLEQRRDSTAEDGVS